MKSRKIKFYCIVTANSVGELQDFVFEHIKCGWELVQSSVTVVACNDRLLFLREMVQYE
jgi:hypothetical protein